MTIMGFNLMQSCGRRLLRQFCRYGLIGLQILILRSHADCFPDGIVIFAVMFVSILYSHSNCVSICRTANIPLLLPPALLLISLSLLSHTSLL